MKKLKFHKMHGAGNDYIYVDARKGKEVIKNPNELSIKVSDRHFGIGSDGLVLIMDSDVADYRMRMFNADGSEAGMCGNASRCVGKYLYDLGITTKEEISLETKSGIKILKLTIKDSVVSSVCVDMEEPRLNPDEIPVLSDPSMGIKLNIEDTEYELTCVSMGNPHAVIFVDDVDNFPVERVGTLIENHPIFPERTNVEFAQVVSDKLIKMRVWERGSGETLACGTGACATLVAASLNAKSTREATISLIGGDVKVAWCQETNHVMLTGAATWVFEGEYTI
ncbi:MAG: diaminopimelate epimerase [Rikenellaceae bacterium]